MSVSTDGQICYGIRLLSEEAGDEDVSFPWDGDKYDGIDDWWTAGVCGYKPPFEIYNTQGEYLDGVSPSEDRIHEYYEHRREFEEAHPFPYELVNACHSDHPVDILAIQETVMVALRGYPETFDPRGLRVYESEAEELLAFCAEHKIGTKGEPSWWLSSYADF